jgi:hypothetical protein
VLASVLLRLHHYIPASNCCRLLCCLLNSKAHTFVHVQPMFLQAALQHLQESVTLHITLKQLLTMLTAAHLWWQAAELVVVQPQHPEPCQLPDRRRQHCHATAAQVEAPQTAKNPWRLHTRGPEVR